MARPTKPGIDYFPLDCKFDDDLQLFITENGADSLGILITVWQIIYQNEGYFAVYDARFPLKVKQRILSDSERIIEIIASSVEWGIFDKKAFNTYKVLTSVGIQKRYFIGSRLKKSVVIYADLMLIDVSNVGNAVNVVGNPLNVNVNVNVKEKVNVNAHNGDSAKCVLFDKFWKAYPNKKSKGQAEKAFEKLKPSEQFILGTVIPAIERAKTSVDWTKDGGQYIPHPATWLNAKGWEDEPVQPPKVKSGWDMVTEKYMGGVVEGELIGH